MQIKAEWLSRTKLLLGDKKLEKLKNSHVLVVGLGGVGAYAAEQICRAGVGRMTIVDGDIITPSNINRQLPATHSQINKDKAEIMSNRLLDINPELKLTVVNEFLKEERIKELVEAEKYDYLVDAIDTLSPKMFLLSFAFRSKIPTVSAMGAGGKFDPSQIKEADISESYNCKLARAVRKRLHRMDIHEGIKVIFSPEEIAKGSMIIDESENKKSNVGTISYMPPLFGCLCASVVLRDLIREI